MLYQKRIPEYRPGTREANEYTIDLGEITLDGRENEGGGTLGLRLDFERGRSDQEVRDRDTIAGSSREEISGSTRETQRV